MIRRAQIAMVLISFCCPGQNNDFLLRDYNNPALLKNIRSSTLYTTNLLLNPEFNIKSHSVGIVLRLGKRPIQSCYSQFGYKHYKEQKFSLSSVQKISSKINFGLNVNLHRLKSHAFKEYKSVSFDIGWHFQSNSYEIDLFIENPFNSGFVKNDIPSRMILSGLYRWDVNLTSIIQIKESILSESYAEHELKYNYENSLSMSIIHALTTKELGLKFGLKKDAIEIQTTYKTHPWGSRVGLSLVYQPFDA